ncbi:Dystrophin, isoform D [Armadillidium vulgare]|nr:Dystrophin, isoform D [Armadillidium vulgare]
MVEFLSEEVYFGSSFVSGAVESCFINASENVGIRENAFLDWVLQEPQTLLWWSTLYRISMAELVCHDVKCSTCKEKPIIGMRYQCLRCLGYNLCQDCFLHGRNSKNHKLSHPLLEYCQESTGGEWGKSLLKIMHHHLKFKHSLAKPRYLTISSSEKTSSLLQDSKDDSFSREILELNENAVPCKTNVSDVSNPNQTSIDITAFLTTENLNNESNRISELLTTPNYFKPRDELQSTYSQSPKTKSAKISSGKGPFLPRFESTPVVSDRGLHPVLSPIETFSNSNEILFGSENSHSLVPQ